MEAGNEERTATGTREKGRERDEGMKSVKNKRREAEER
jgi:hypothetical protein